MSPLSIKYPVSVVILYVEGKSVDVQQTKKVMEEIKKALVSRGHIVRTVKVNKRNWRKAIHTPGQIFFNLVEDETWELYQKVAWGLEKLGKAQVAHDKAMLAYGINKSVMKQKLIRAKITTPKYRIFLSGEKYLHHIKQMEYPLIVKPAGQHAGIGISQDSVVIDEREADERIKYLYKNYVGDVLVEEFIDGREVTVTALGNGKHVAVLPAAELIFVGEFNNNWPIYSYDAKWTESSWEYWSVKIECPANLTKDLENKINKLTKRAFIELKISDVVRMDMRIDGKNKVYIVDVNPSPSLDFHEDEGTYRAAKALGWSYEDLIETIVAMTYKRVFKRMPDRILERQLMLTTSR